MHPAATAAVAKEAQLFVKILFEIDFNKPLLNKTTQCRERERSSHLTGIDLVECEALCLAQRLLCHYFDAV